MMKTMRSLVDAIAQDDSFRIGKLRAENLEYFDPEFESEHNEFIISSERHVYYRDMFV